MRGGCDSIAIRIEAQHACGRVVDKRRSRAARRAVDEKAQQLKVLANQSALVAGFSMVVLVESNIPPDINGALLTLFGGVTACVIALMLVSTLEGRYGYRFAHTYLLRTLLDCTREVVE